MKAEMIRDKDGCDIEYQSYPLRDGDAGDTYKIMQLALDAGIVLLSNGAEIWRVEDTISHICKAFHVEDVDAFILSNAIFITGNNEKEKVFAKVKHIPLSGVHLGIVTEVNDLSREISAGKYSVGAAAKRLEEIRNSPSKNAYYRALASGMGAGCFCYILKASIAESLMTVGIGSIVLLFALWAERHGFPKLVKNMLGGGLIALLALLATYLPFAAGVSVDKMIIGAIMPLIPGVAFVNSIRELANTDFLSGTVRMLDTIMVFMYIAIGASTVLSLYHGFLGGGF